MRTECLFFIFTIIYVNAYEYGQVVEEGSMCRKRTGETGICRHFSFCPSAIQAVRRNGRPEICSFSGIYPIVCCRDGTYPYEHIPPVHNRVALKSYSFYIPFDERSTSLRKCKQYHGADTHTTNEIRHEGKHDIQQYPHLAIIGYIGYEEDWDIKWSCSGSLISEDFVLVAAHCLATTLGEPKYVRLGVTDFYSPTDDEHSQEIQVKKIYIHPNYKLPSYYNDIGLIQIRWPVKITPYVMPACLGVTEDLNGTLPEALRWDIESTYDKDSAILKTDHYAYVSNEKCRKVYRPVVSATLADGIRNDVQICAGVPDTLSKNAIYGPLQITNFFYEFNNFPEIVGIASFGKIDAVPGVYTRIHPYISWIEKIVWP